MAEPTSPPANKLPAKRLITDVAIPMERGQLIFKEFDAVVRVADMLCRSGLVPAKHFKNPESVAVAILLGISVGLNPVQAVQNIWVVNERPAIYGDALLAIARRSAQWVEEDFLEYYEENGQKLEPGRSPKDVTKATAICQTRRKEHKRPMLREFSWQDAIRSRLAGKEGPWQTYPARQLMWRARGWCLRDNFGDELKGLALLEEVLDIESTATGGGRRAGVRQTAEEAIQQQLQQMQGDIIEGAARSVSEPEPTQNNAAPLPEPATQPAAKKKATPRRPKEETTQSGPSAVPAAEEAPPPFFEESHHGTDPSEEIWEEEPPAP